MKNALLFGGIVAAVGLIWFSMTDFSVRVNGQEQAAREAPRKVEYNALPRRKIEALAPKEKALDFDQRLTHGLNALANDGWRLVAIEPYHARTTRGGGSVATMHHPVTYVFVRDK